MQKSDLDEIRTREPEGYPLEGYAVDRLATKFSIILSKRNQLYPNLNINNILKSSYILQNGSRFYV